MEYFENPWAKLFYAVYRLHSQKKINEEEKVKLKSLIITGEQNITILLNKYLQDQNSEYLMTEIVKLIKPLRRKPEAIILSKNTVDESSSPLGTFLHEKKKRQSAEHELKLSLQNTEIVSIEETHDENIHHN
jgi:hypothetical protein